MSRKHSAADNRTARLHFTEEELSSSSVKAAAKRAEAAADRADQAKKKLPTRKTVKRITVSDEKAGTLRTKLSFEDRTKRTPSRLQHTAKAAPANFTMSRVHSQLREAGEADSSATIADQAVTTAETGIRTQKALHDSVRMRAYHKAAKAQATSDKENLRALYRNSEASNPDLHKTTRAHAQQKRAIKKEYAAAKAGRTTSNVSVNAAEITEKAANSAKKVGSRLQEFFVSHKKGFLILGIVAAMVALLMSVTSSCSMVAEGIASAIGTTTYPSEDADMLSAEAMYCSLEADLQSQLDRYDETHSYDEYIYELDEIGHDPYVLISMLTAIHGGPWTISEVEGDIQNLFGQQYELTETVTEEIRSRTETETRTREVEDPDTGEVIEEEYEEEVEVEYSYYICTVTLVNNDLSHIPSMIMTESQLSTYAMYMATLGNRQDLFPGSGYIGRYGSYLSYDIPGEALNDEQFANMIREAEKYLGYPYVWGGSSPSTSFDCSGFVCWVINNCGNGWNVGRVDAEVLRQMCAIIPASAAKPGDIIFFQGTYDTDGASHVGIYVGNNMMIHCGDPISYADISSSYWQQHFFCFGRIS